MNVRQQIVLVGCCVLVGCSAHEHPVKSEAGLSVDRPARPEATKAKRIDRSDVKRRTAHAAHGAVAEVGTFNLNDVTASSQIAFRHTDGGSGRRYIVETVASGLALLDYDGDGFVDIYFLNGAPLPGTQVHEIPRNALYRNNGNWTFTDVTNTAGVGDEGYGLGVAAGDFDDDGDADLYVNNFGPNVLYANNGDGTFSVVTEQAGVGGGERFGAGASFLDIEGDGDLDLYVANYVDFTFQGHKTKKIGDYEFPAGPTDYAPQPDLLFRNEGDGQFTDVSESNGISRCAAPGMGLVCADFDDDGDSDIFVCSDNAPNLLFQNDGHGKFQEVGLSSGVAHDLNGNNNGNMGVDCGDYDNDGNLDLFVTNYQAELAVLYRNLGDGFFADVTRATGVGASSFPHVKWGTTLADFDNDGDRDVFIACGHFMDNIRYIDDRTDVRVPNFLVANQGYGKFLDVSRQSGSGLGIVESSRGAGFDDLDNDGDLDVVVLNVNSGPSIIRNDTHPAGPSVEIVLRGTKTNRDGVGARVKVIAQDRMYVAEVLSGRGYQSHYGSRLHFGLGSADKVSRIEIRWLGGGVDVIDNPVVAPTLLIKEGGSVIPLYLESP